MYLHTSAFGDFRGITFTTNMWQVGRGTGCNDWQQNIWKICEHVWGKTEKITQCHKLWDPSESINI